MLREQPIPGRAERGRPSGPVPLVGTKGRVQLADAAPPTGEVEMIEAHGRTGSMRREGGPIVGPPSNARMDRTYFRPLSVSQLSAMSA